MTNDLERRVLEHRAKEVPGFTALYNCTKLVYVEFTDAPTVAIEREKQLKGWTRKRKNELIESENPGYRDLFDDFFS